jgi:hypothetical protein
MERIRMSGNAAIIIFIITCAILLHLHYSRKNKSRPKSGMLSASDVDYKAPDKPKGGLDALLPQDRETAAQCLDYLTKVERENEGRAVSRYISRLRSAVSAKPELFCHEPGRRKQSPEVFMQTVLAANLRRDLASGAFHAAKGRLNADGAMLLSLFRSELNKLCAAGAASQEEARKNVEKLEKDIARAG